MPENINVGLIGYGFGGRVFHAPFIDAVDGLALTAVVTSQADKVAADYPGVKVVGDTAVLPADPAIDLIVISTPNTSHFSLAKKALQAGKHVVVDKPFTIDTAEADALIDLAAEAGLVLSVYQNRRFDSDYRTLKQLVSQGKLGQVHTYQAHYDRYSATVLNRWRERDEPGAGILYDLGAHLIDQAVDLMGRPDSVWADLGYQRTGAQSDDYFHVVLRFGERRAIVHGGSLVAQPPFHFAVHGDKGSFIKHGLDPQEEALLAGERPYSPDWGVEPEAIYGKLVKPSGESVRISSLQGGYEDFYAGMVKAILDGDEGPVTAVSARNVIAIIQAATESAQTGRVIDLAGKWRET